MGEREDAKAMRSEQKDLKRGPKIGKPVIEEPVTEHTVVSGDSLSAIAQKYYGAGGKEQWMAIYEANKELIGDNPSLIRPGQVLKIPKL